MNEVLNVEIVRLLYFSCNKQCFLQVMWDEYINMVIKVINKKCDCL